MNKPMVILILLVLSTSLGLFAGCESREEAPVPTNTITKVIEPAKDEPMVTPETIIENPPAPEKEEIPEEHTGPYIDERLPPMLVNGTNYIPDDFTVELKKVRDYNFEITTAEALEKLFDAAADDGISLWIVSGYRSTEKQIANFNAKKQEWMAAGFSEKEAELKTAEFIAYPGTSEHSIGRAVDLNSLEQSFENTSEFTWLYENCAKFGFVLRYPKDKEDITNISYEPWHYRYVGVEHAKYIMENKICLEEYIDYLAEE